MKLSKRVARVPRSVKLRLVLPVLLAALAALLVAGCGGGSDSRRRRHRSGQRRAAERADLHRLHRAPGRRNEDEHRGAGEEARRDRQPRRPDRHRTRKLRLRATAKNSTSKRKSNPGSAKKAGSSCRNTKAKTSKATARRSRRPTKAKRRTSSTSRSKRADEEVEDGSYEGVDFKVQEDETTIGVFDGLRRLRRRRSDLQVDGRRLRTAKTWPAKTPTPDAIANVPDESAADVYVDIGGLIEEAGDEIDAETADLPRQRRDRTRRSDRRRQPGPRLRPGRDRPQHQPQRRQPALGRRLGAARLAARHLGRRLRLGRIRQALQRRDRPASTRKASPARCRRTS